MKEKIIYIFWGVMFLLIGAGLLVGIIDYQEIPEKTWFIIEIVGSAAFVVTYFLVGTKKWGWLLPAFVLAGMAVDLSSELYHTFLAQPNGVPIMIGIALWFLTGFLIDRRRWGLLIPAYIMVFAAVETVVNTMVVPSILRGEDNASFLFALTSGAATMLMLALPFFVVYFVSKKSWWALIPAGTFTSIGLVITLDFFIQGNPDTQTGILSGVLLLGVAATFGILWLRRTTVPTDWAKYPAAGLFVLSILAFILGDAWNSLSVQTKAIVFAVASGVFFVCYLVTGLRKWGWLFPTLFCAAMALTIWMSMNNMEDTPWIGLPVLASFALPFYVGFALEPKHRWLLIPAFVTTMVMVMSMATDSDYEGVVVMFTFALPFFAVYFWSRKNWWAFIPAGIFASIGVVALLDNVAPRDDYIAPQGTLEWGVYTWVLLLGFAAAFGVPWLRRKDQPSGWTIYPAIGFLALAILNLILGEHFQEYWLACTMLVTGCAILLAVFTRKQPAARIQTPEIRA